MMSGRETPVSAASAVSGPKVETSITEHRVEEFQTESSPPAPFDSRATNRLLRKVDFALMPLLALLYL
jgi:hypothetical protein